MKLIVALVFSRFLSEFQGDLAMYRLIKPTLQKPHPVWKTKNI